MDSDVLTRIHRTVSRISVALESGLQVSDSLRLELGKAINNVERFLANTRSRGYKTFFMLNSIVGILTFMSRKNSILGLSDSEKS